MCDIIEEAKGLLEPGEELDNPEYTRALIELCSSVTGVEPIEVARRIGVVFEDVYRACDARSKKH